jgi:hypothetical protein
MQAGLTCAAGPSHPTPASPSLRNPARASVTGRITFDLPFHAVSALVRLVLVRRGVRLKVRLGLGVVQAV